MKYHPATVTPGRSAALPTEQRELREKEVLSRRQDINASLIGWILQGGVIVSGAVILFGLLLLPFRPGGLTLSRLETFPHSLSQVWTGLLGLHPQAFIALGLLLLIATPVLRVAVSVVAFAFEHDRLYVVITLLVLAILIASFLMGKGGA